MEKKLNLGIEWLRIASAFMICILHILGKGGVLYSLTPGTIPHIAYWLLETLSLCAVNEFALISGFVANNRKKTNAVRLFDLWMQVFFYSFFITILFFVFGKNDNYGYSFLLKCAFPITFNIFWYFTAYFVVSLIKPVLHPFLFSQSESQAKYMIVILVLVFCCVGEFTDSFQINHGYSAIWLIIMYCVGVLMKQGKVMNNQKSILLLLVLFFCIGAQWYINLSVTDLDQLSYSSFFVVVSSMIIMILFSRISSYRRRIITVSSLSFGIYLFQLSPLIWAKLLDNRAAFVVKLPLLQGVGVVFLLSIGLFLLGALCEKIRSLIYNKLNIHRFSEKMVFLLNHCLSLFASMLN